MTSVQILAVDDREENLLALRVALEQPELEIVCVTSGTEAIELARKHEYAVILMDVQMPGMDGFETARRIRAEEQGRTTPIIFVTAIHRSDDYAEQGYIAGAVDYLYKPLNIEILRAKVSVFVELFRKTLELREQSETLRVSALREQENQFLREALRARDEFLSIVSHELKTPITPLSLQIQAFLELTEEDQLPVVPKEKLQRMLRTSKTQVDRLSRLISELLDVSRIVEGKLKVTPEATDMNDIVRSVIEGFSHEIKRSGSQVELDLPETARGRWDRFRIEQVLINLLTNAMKYGDKKPIRISVKNVPEGVVLTLKDQGIGVGPEDQKRIFDRFERAVSSKNYGGLGLGLYISQKIVQLHGGRIEIESRLGEGAEFRVKLPLVTADS